MVMGRITEGEPSGFSCMEFVNVWNGMYTNT